MTTEQLSREQIEHMRIVWCAWPNIIALCDLALRALSPQQEAVELKLAHALNAIIHTTNHCGDEYTALSKVAQQVCEDIKPDLRALLGTEMAGITIQHGEISLKPSGYLVYDRAGNCGITKTQDSYSDDDKAEFELKFVSLYTSPPAPSAEVVEAPQDRLSRHKDIILEAIQEYDAYMICDDFDAQGCLDKIIERMRKRIDGGIPPRAITLR